MANYFGYHNPIASVPVMPLDFFMKMEELFVLLAPKYVIHIVDLVGLSTAKWSCPINCLLFSFFPHETLFPILKSFPSTLNISFDLPSFFLTPLI